MANKTRKHIWSVPLVASIAIIGVLAAFVVLANNPSVAMAQAGDPCAGMTDDERSDFILDGGTCGAPTDRQRQREWQRHRHRHIESGAGDGSSAERADECRHSGRRRETHGYLAGPPV